MHGDAECQRVALLGLRVNDLDGECRFLGSLAIGDVGEEACEINHAHHVGVVPDAQGLEAHALEEGLRVAGTGQVDLGGPSLGCECGRLGGEHHGLDLATGHDIHLDRLLGLDTLDHIDVGDLGGVECQSGG